MRYELTDEMWAAIKPMLPNKPRGVPRVNDRRVLNELDQGARHEERRMSQLSCLRPTRIHPARNGSSRSRPSVRKHQGDRRVRQHRLCGAP
jgi:transposase